MEQVSTPVLSIVLESRGDIGVVAVGGDVDHAVRTTLRDALSASLARHPRGLVLDLTAVRLFSAAGLSVLAWLYRIALETGTQATLVATQRSVLNPMAITRIDELFDIRPTVGQAVGHHNALLAGDPAGPDDA